MAESRKQKAVLKLGIKQQLVLDYDLCETTERLQEALPSNIIWEWVKGHQTQGVGHKWKLEVALNNFCDKKSEQTRLIEHMVDPDPFFPDQKIGIPRLGKRFHESPREEILDSTHDLDLR